jgi:hypothetical protein
MKQRYLEMLSHLRTADFAPQMKLVVYAKQTLGSRRYRCSNYFYVSARVNSLRDIVPQCYGIEYGSNSGGGHFRVMRQDRPIRSPECTRTGFQMALKVVRVQLNEPWQHQVSSTVDDMVGCREALADRVNESAMDRN